jgi:hypothetical protein
MIIPIFITFIIVSFGGLLVGLWYKNGILLLGLNLFWWLGSFISAYFAWLAWRERGFSENWAMIGFMICTLPYTLLTSFMLGGELFFIRTWQNRLTFFNQIAAVVLWIFLMAQLILGVLSML